MSTGSTVVGIDVQILTGAVTVGLAGWTDTTGARAATPYRTDDTGTIAVGLP